MSALMHQCTIVMEMLHVIILLAHISVHAILVSLGMARIVKVSRKLSYLFRFNYLTWRTMNLLVCPYRN